MDATKDYMDPDKVAKIAQGFATFATILKVVSGILEAQIMIMKATAFIGNVGGAAVASFLKTIKPKIDKMAKQCEELSQKVDGSVKLWREANK